MAICIFEDLFIQSLTREDDEIMETSNAVKTIVSTQNDDPVDADQFAKFLNFSYDKAAAKLREAAQAGVILRVNGPAKNNNKRYLPAQSAKFVPDPMELLAGIKGVKKPVIFVDPITGEKKKLS